MTLKPEFEERIIRESLRLGQPLPDRIKNAPSIEDSEHFYIDAFFDLCTERQLGFGEGPIPITAILRYSDHYELSIDDRQDLVTIIRSMDQAYLEHQAAKNQTKKEK